MNAAQSIQNECFQGDNVVKILALTRYGQLGASSRLRFYQCLPALRALGIEVQLAPLLRDDYLRRFYENRATDWLALFKDYLSRLFTLLESRRFDLLWIEKELFPNLPAWFESLLAHRGIRYVMDCDDAVFHNYDSAANPLKRSLAGKIDTVMRHADLVICGNSYLAERARSAGARRVEIVPTVIDLERYPAMVPAENDRPVIGWIGSPSTVKYLEIVAAPLKELAAVCPLQLRVVGAQLAWHGLDVVCVPWTESTEVSEIRKFDIGIMPLADSPWERGKCGYKLIQYMACGLPVVASPVGVNRDIITQGQNGYLAGSPEEWKSALRSLCADADARRRMGARGRQTVEQVYCLQVTARRLAQLFHECLEQKGE